MKCPRGHDVPEGTSLHACDIHTSNTVDGSTWTVSLTDVWRPDGKVPTLRDVKDLIASLEVAP